MSVGSVIKQRRIALNMKQEDVAEKIGVTVQTYGKWENDKTEPKASQIAALSNLLNLPEKVICSGKYPENLSDNPMQFMNKFGKLVHHVDDFSLVLTMYDFIEDEEGFYKALLKASELPKEHFEG
jgi:transcriptional regulator with XRE-family HTH domain